MEDILGNYDIEKLPDRIKNVRKNRSEQYKHAKKYFDDISKQYEKSSQQYKDAETYFQQYEKFKHCMSQETLAEAINVKRQTVIDWEKGHTAPSIEKLIQLCSVFDCNMDYLLGFVETPITEPVSIAHYFSGIDSSIIKYGRENEDYLDCLNFFMLPENCASLFNDITISAWRNYMKTSAIVDIKSPLKEEVIKAYDEYSAMTPMHEISRTSYKSFLQKKFPRQKIVLHKEHSENGYMLKGCFQRIIYQNFFDGKEFNYNTFINYLVDNTFEQFSQNALIETHKIKLAKVFIDLFEKYLED